jgi:hypothetical protein
MTELYARGFGVAEIVNQTGRSSEGIRNVLKQEGVFKKRSNKPKVETPASTNTLRVHVPGYPTVDVVNTAEAVKLLKERGFSTTLGNILNSVQSMRGRSIDTSGFWIERLAPVEELEPDISKILDETIPKTFEFNTQRLMAILDTYPLPLDVVEKVLGSYYNDVYLPDQFRKKALKNIQDIMAAAGLTSEDVIGLFEG